MPRMVLMFIWVWVVNGICQELPVEMKQLFNSKEIIKTIDFKDDVVADFQTGNQGFVVVCSDEKDDQLNIVNLFDNAGNMLWQKQHERVYAVTMDKNANNIIVIHDWKNDYYTHTCYDKKGTQKWQKQITAPGLKISDSGLYAITTMKSGDTGIGEFQLFDAQTGNEIQTIFQNSNSNFFAEFIDDNTILVLLQETEVVYDEKKIDLIDQEIMTLEAKRETLSDRKEIKKNKRDIAYLKNKRRNCKDLEYKPVKFQLYKIKENGISVSKELFTKNGKLLWKKSKGDLSVSNQKDRIIIDFNYGSNKGPARPNDVALVFTKRGELLGEIKQFPTIHSMKIVDDSLMIIFHGVRANKKIQLYDYIKHQKKWEISASDLIKGKIKSCVLTDTNLVISSCNKNYMNSMLCSLISLTGEMSGKWNEYLYFPGSTIIVFSKTEHILYLMN